MGPNENVTYNTGKGHYRNTVGLTKEGVQKPSPMRPPKKNKTKHTKRKCRFLRGKVSNALSWSQDQEATVQAASSHFSGFLFKSSRFWEWNLVHGTHSLLLLEKGFHFQFHQQPHPPEPKLVRSILNFITSCSLFPHTQTDKYSSIHSPPNHKVCEYAFFVVVVLSQFRTL